MSDLLDSSWLRHIVIALAVAATFTLLSRLFGRLRPAETDRDGAVSGRISPSKALVGILVVVCLGIGGLALYFGWFQQGAVAALIVAIAFLLGGAACATSLLPIYDIVWDADGIEGATSLWFPPIGPRRGRILWKDVVAAGSDMSGWYVANQASTKIHWNWIYPGYPVLMLRIEAACPWLFDEGSGPQAQDCLR